MTIKCTGEMVTLNDGTQTEMRADWYAQDRYMMSVRELIEELSDFNPDAVVMLYSPHNDDYEYCSNLSTGKEKARLKVYAPKENSYVAVGHVDLELHAVMIE